MDIAKSKGMIITVDTAKVEAGVDEILAANAAQVEQYKNGETKVFGFIMGQCTKALKGVATPKIIKEILESKLKAAAASTASDAEKKEDVKDNVIDTSKLTKYENADKYVPENDGKMLMIDTADVKKEFMLADAKANMGKEVLRLCSQNKEHGQHCIYRSKNFKRCYTDSLLCRQLQGFYRGSERGLLCKRKGYL